MQLMGRNYRGLNASVNAPHSYGLRGEGSVTIRVGVRESAAPTSSCATEGTMRSGTETTQDKGTHSTLHTVPAIYQSVGECAAGERKYFVALGVTTETRPQSGWTNDGTTISIYSQGRAVKSNLFGKYSNDTI